MITEKVVWQGNIVGVQPRIQLWRSFDQRADTYQGYILPSALRPAPSFWRTAHGTPPTSRATQRRRGA